MKALTTAATQLVKAMRIMDNAVAKSLPHELSGIVTFQAKGAAAASVAAAWIPGAGGVAATATAAGFIWAMYIRINKALGCPFSEHLLKSITAGIATNLAAYFAGSVAINTVFSFIPVVGNIGASAVAGGIGYGATLASGILYLKILTRVFQTQQDPSTLDANVLKDIATKVLQNTNLKDLCEQARQEYNHDGEAAYDDPDVHCESMPDKTHGLNEYSKGTESKQLHNLPNQFPATAAAINPDNLAAAYTAARKHSDDFAEYVHLAQDNKKLLKRALKHYAHLSTDEQPLLFFDNTEDGSATEGFVLTDRCIYICNDEDENADRILLEAIHTVTQKTGFFGGITAAAINGTEIDLSILNSKSKVLLCDLLIEHIPVK